MSPFTMPCRIKARKGEYHLVDRETDSVAIIVGGLEVHAAADFVENAVNTFEAGIELARFIHDNLPMDWRLHHRVWAVLDAAKVRP